MKRPVDSQRSRLYKAENAVFKGTDWDVPFRSIEDLEAWLDGLLDGRWMRARWGRLRVPVVGGSGNNALYRDRIMLTRDGRRPWIVLHELAHVLASSRTVAAHGPEFAAHYVLLVEVALGVEPARALRERFTADRIRYRTGIKSVPKPTRTVPTKREAIERRRAVAARPPNASELSDAAATIRRAVKAGAFGPAGCKPRQHALETARRLDDLPGR